MTWLLQCWGIMAHDMKPDGSEAKQPGSLSWDMGIDKGFGKKTNCQPLEMTPVMQEGRYSLKDNLVVHPSK